MVSACYCVFFCYLTRFLSYVFSSHVRIYPGAYFGLSDSVDHEVDYFVKLSPDYKQIVFSDDRFPINMRQILEVKTLSGIHTVYVDNAVCGSSVRDCNAVVWSGCGQLGGRGVMRPPPPLPPPQVTGLRGAAATAGGGPAVRARVWASKSATGRAGWSRRSPSPPPLPSLASTPPSGLEHWKRWAVYCVHECSVCCCWCFQPGKNTNIIGYLSQVTDIYSLFPSLPLFLPLPFSSPSSLLPGIDYPSQYKVVNSHAFSNSMSNTAYVWHNVVTVCIQLFQQNIIIMVLLLCPVSLTYPLVLIFLCTVQFHTPWLCCIIVTV